MNIIRHGQNLGNITPNNGNKIWLARRRKAKLPTWLPLPYIDSNIGDPWLLDLNNFVVDGIPPYTFTLASGSLPGSITLNPDGTFSGTVTDLSGSGDATFNATSLHGTVESGTLSWSIIPAP